MRVNKHYFFLRAFLKQEKKTFYSTYRRIAAEVICVQELEELVSGVLSGKHYHGLLEQPGSGSPARHIEVLLSPLRPTFLRRFSRPSFGPSHSTLRKPCSFIIKKHSPFSELCIFRWVQLFDLLHPALGGITTGGDHNLMICPG
jgi:hypothetical protein